MTCKIPLRRNFNGKSLFFSICRLPRRPSSFQRTPALRVGGSADQQLRRQRVLGASAPELPERPHTGVQGESGDARDGSEGGDPKWNSLCWQSGSLYRFQLSC